MLAIGVVASGLAAPAATATQTTAAAAKPAPSYPWGARLRDAKRYARARLGSVSFAAVDEGGRLRGFRGSTTYSSASLVKAMLLVAYLNQRGVRRGPLHRADRRLLAPMILVSDNDAATAVYERIGPGAVSRLARRAGMRRFQANPVWGGCQVTARDQARFFSRLRSLTPKEHRHYALGLLRRIVPEQRWGIPRASPRGWSVHFKGGWYRDSDGWRVHQAALVRRGRHRISIAVLTRGNPGLAYGATTIRGVTARLLRGYRSPQK
jgi:hypothetical protein